MLVTSRIGRPTLFRLLAVFLLVFTAGCTGGGGGGTSPSDSTPSEPASSDSTSSDSTPSEPASSDSTSSEPATPEQTPLPPPPPPPPPPPCFQTADFGCAQEAEFRRLQEELAAPYAEDTAFRNQWGLGAINAARAFANVELAAGAGAVPGAGVTVGFLDTGIDLEHPLFTGSVTEEFLLGAEDEDGTETSHGTAVASVVGADFLGLAPEFRQHGFRGVAPGADLKMFAIPLSSGARPYLPISLVGLASVDREYQDVVNTLRGGGVDVANMSFGFEGVIDDYSEADLRATLGNAIAAMAQADAEEKIILVWAAGNDHNKDCTAGTDHCVQGAINAVSPEILAGLPARIQELRGHAVAAVAVGRDSDGDGYPDITPFSNRCGIAADWCIAAPGEDVKVAIFGRIDGVEGQRGVGTGRGTSFAAPMVAGGLAVMKQLFRGQLGSEELVARLYATASKEGPFSNASVYGQGLMDLGAATSPVGRAMLTGGRTVSAPGVDVHASGMVSGLALGDGLARALADQEVAAFDRLGAPFWFGLSGFLERDTGPTLAEHLRGLLSRGSEAGPRTGRGIVVGTHWHGAASPPAKRGRHPLRLGFLGAPDPAGGSHLSLAQGAMTVSLALRGGFDATALATPGTRGRAPVRGLAMAYRLPGVPAGIRVGWLAERRTMLGTSTGGAFGRVATEAMFGGFETAFQAGPWRLFANAEVGAAAPRIHEGLLTRMSLLTTSAFSLGAARRTAARDTLTLGLSQALRVEDGQATLSIPVGRTPQGEVVRSSLQADLSPSGRQLEISARWVRQLAAGGELAADATWTREPGHDAHADPSLRFLAGWRARF